MSSSDSSAASSSFSAAASEQQSSVAAAPSEAAAAGSRGGSRTTTPSSSLPSKALAKTSAQYYFVATEALAGFSDGQQVVGGDPAISVSQDRARVGNRSFLTLRRDKAENGSEAGGFFHDGASFFGARDGVT